MGRHRSRPYNPLIANTFFRAGFIEAWGRGIEKIKDNCKKSGNPMPEYTIKREDIMVMFKSLAYQTNQANQAKLNDLEERIITVIKMNPRMSQKKIAEMVEETYSMVKFSMGKMKEKGIITRVGSSQKGEWIVRD